MRLSTSVGLAYLLASCTAAPAALPPERMSQVVIGRSTRAEVLQSLGEPAHTTHSLAGESWVYTATSGGDGEAGLRSGIGTAAGVAGAFIPFVGLVGPGLGLAGMAAGHPEAVTTSLAITFRADGVVQDCLYTTTAPPSVTAATPPGCARPPA